MLKHALKAILIVISTTSFKFSHSHTTTIQAKIKGHLPILKQPKSMDCWATVITMLSSWKDNNDYNVAKYIEKLGEPWYSNFKNNKGLPSTLQDSLFLKLGLKGEDPANYTILAYVEFIEMYGPLWVTTSNKADGMSAHAKVLFSIEGDGTYDNTWFYFIDPRKGKVIKQQALEYAKEFENEARFIVKKYPDGDVDFRIQIIHW